MKNKRILFGICGSFCNHAHILKELKQMVKENDVQVVVSQAVYESDTRFFKAKEFISELESITNHTVMHTIVEAETIGPMNVYDIMVIAPMTATVASKLANGIYDHPVTLAAKAMIRNEKDIVFGIATNDGLGISGRHIFTLLNYRHMYAVPFRQDAPFEKGRSIVAEWSLLMETCDKALDGLQIQPILLGGKS